MNDEKINAQHPDPNKQGVRISKSKYDLIKDNILKVFRSNSELTYSELAAAVRKNLNGKFDGSITWYVTVVKLDLEARGSIERIPKTRPQKLKLRPAS